MQIPEWALKEIESTNAILLANDFIVSIKDVVIDECDQNFEGRKVSDKFNLWVRSLSNEDFIDLFAIILKRL